MQIVDLDAETKPLFCMCLEDWQQDADMKAAAERRRLWVDRSATRGVRAKLVRNDAGTLAGMVQYLPIEESTVDGARLHFITCIWVHGHPQGPGNLQGHGLGTALLAAAEDDARARGAQGMAAWGLWLPFWMKASWFKKHGYRAVDRNGMASLLFKPFSPEAQPPRWFRRTKKPVELQPGCVTVTSFVNGSCTVGALAAERARRVAAEFGDRVAYREVDTSEHQTVAEWGLADALFVDGKSINIGPPPTVERIRKVIAKRVARL